MEHREGRLDRPAQVPDLRGRGRADRRRGREGLHRDADQLRTPGTEDTVEITTTGATELRYTGGQFIQNWQTPKGADMCYRTTMTAQDGSLLTAYFKTK